MQPKASPCLALLMAVAAVLADIASATAASETVKGGLQRICNCRPVAVFCASIAVATRQRL